MADEASRIFPNGIDAYRQAAIDATLNRLFDATVERAQSRIDWYDKKGSERARVSKRLRWWALMLFSAGTIAPILLTFVTKLSTAYQERSFVEVSKFPWTELGFVFLALAGALIVFDQFFGASSSWLRFRQTQVRLEAMLEEFRYAWISLMARSGGVLGVTVNPDDFVKLAHEFSTKIQAIAEEETKAWADEYRAALDRFDQNPDLKVKLNKQGEGAAATGGAEQKREAGAAALGSTTEAASDDKKPTTVTVRLAIDLTNVEDGSLAVSLDNQPILDASDGYAEVPLEIGVPHLFTARARDKTGKLLTGELPITPRAEDEHAPLSLTLAPSTANN